MSLLFQHPALLGLLALAGLPVLVHLLSRARPPVYRFSNLEFLRRVLRSTARIRRPKDWLLLALRTLALFALAAAFAWPFLISDSASLPGEQSTVILLVDRSASMAAREGAGSRFDAACAQATRFLEQAKPDHANLIWIDAEPDAVFPDPGPNLSFLTDLLQQARPHPEAGALTAAFDLALRQLAKVSAHRELVIISDFQASAWRDFSPALPHNLVIRTQRVATSSPPNVAVSRLIPQPAEPVAGQDLTILTRVRNFSAVPVRTQLTLDADGARQSQPIDLPAWGEADAAFVLRPAAPGPLPISASIEADAFPADDARHAVVHVRDSLRLALTSPPASPEAKLLGKLARSLAWLEPVTDLTSDRRPDFHFISAWSGDRPADLRNAALAGTTVILRPAAACPLAALRTLLQLPANPVDGPLALEVSPAGWSVIPEESHPANQLFRAGDFGNPFAGTFRERLRLPASLASLPGIRPIASFADGIPALLEGPTDKASILLWNLPLDPAKTDWPTQGSFLPAIAEILLRTRPRSSAEPAYALPGTPLTWSSTDPAHAGALTLLGPAAEPIEITESTTADGTLWQSKAPATPGLYRWQISGQPIAFSAVNFPDSESDLRPLEATPAFGKLEASSDSLVRQAALAQGLPLWPWLALAGILCLMLESIIHTRQITNHKS
ncbi:MAG: VWA domain-containing protein [Verrucomicrobia bacterium]|nr:VWA domain-containing protein [Verrucomicrobiota bacterium]